MPDDGKDAAGPEAAPASPPPDNPVAAALAKHLAHAHQAAKDKRYGEADGICRDLLRAHPGLAGALGLRGSVAAIEGQVDLAIELLEQAIAAQPQNATWRSTLGDMYRMACRMDEALALGKEVVRAQPRHPGFLVNLGKIYSDRGDFDEALTHYIAALAIEPENPNAHLGIGQILLARGQLRSGWIEYEWRNQLEQAQGRIPPIKALQWNGMAMPRGRVLLIGDQGFGDTIQFCRYIPMVAERCQEVVVAGAQDFGSLLRTIPGAGRLFNRWAEIPGFSAWCMMSSLPYLFGTELDTIPSQSPYLRPDPAKVAVWRDRVAAMAGGLRRVGLFWSGRASHPNNLRRSMFLAQLQALRAVPGVCFFSLQKEISRPDSAELAAWPNLHGLSADLTDFDETAALISNLDLVITVDSAVGHLAGALGRPVWLMLAAPSDWRWLLDRADTPWYPSMRLYRQPRPGDWTGLVNHVAAALKSHFEG